MWTKIRNKLIEMLSESLKDKIDFHMSAYRFGWRSASMNHLLPTITITYNKEIILRTYENMDYINSYGIRNENHYFDTEHFFNALREYLNNKHEETRFDKDEYMRLFTLLDKRTGKRTLKRLIEDYNNCSIKELKRIYEIRFKEENINLYSM